MSDTECEVIISVSDKDVKISSTGGGEKEGEVAFDELRKATIDIFQTWLLKGQIQSRTELEVLGRILFDTLFRGEVLSFFKAKFNDAKKVRSRLRIQLRFDAKAADLAKLPWEYLYYYSSGKGFFLSNHVDLVLSRYIPTDDDRLPLDPEERPLRILVVVSQPTDLGPVIAEPVIEAIQKLAGVSEKPLITIERCDKPSVAKFLKALETKPHVLHFIGHGRFNQHLKQGEIALLDYDEANAEWCTDKVFAEYFTQMRAVPRLVLLHVCESGAVDFEAQFSGLAPQLIKAGVDAVVAMQYPIPNKAAISFSRAFYAELVKGNPVDEAVQQGRWWITIDDPKAYNSRIFGTPVLYMHSRDGIILAESDVSEHKPATAKSGQQVRIAPNPDIQPEEKVSVALDRRKIGLIQKAAIMAAGAQQYLASEAIKQVDWATPETIQEQLEKCIKNDSGEKVSIFLAMLEELSERR